MSDTKTTTLLDPWDLVVTRSAERPLTFAVVAVASDATTLRIANTDRTTTLVGGNGLRTDSEQPDGTGVRVRLVDGTVTSLRRLDQNGDLLEALDGVYLTAKTFSSPPAGTSCLTWAMDHFDDRNVARAAGLSDRFTHGGLGGGALDSDGRTANWFRYVVAPVAMAMIGLMLYLNR